MQKGPPCCGPAALGIARLNSMEQQTRPGHTGNWDPVVGPEDTSGLSL